MTSPRIDSYNRAENVDPMVYFGSGRFQRDGHQVPTYHPPTVEILNNTRSYVGIPVARGESMSEKSISKTQFWVGIFVALLTTIATGCIAAWTISNSINDKVNSSRQELTNNIQSSRLEVMAKIDRIEDKMESNNKETINSLMKIQSTLDSQKK